LPLFPYAGADALFPGEADFTWPRGALDALLLFACRGFAP